MAAGNRCPDPRMRKRRVHATSIVVASLMLFASCEEQFEAEDYWPQGTISSDSIPADVGDAVERMHRLFPDVTKQALLRCGNPRPIDNFCRDFLNQVRVPLQRLLSNEWVRPANSPLKDVYADIGITSPEGVSSALLFTYVEYLESIQ